MDRALLIRRAALVVPVLLLAWLALVAPARAEVVTPTVVASPSGVTEAQEVTFAWTGSVPEPLNRIEYQGAVVTDPEATPETTLPPGNTVERTLTPEGTYYFRVRAVERNIANGIVAVSDYGTLAVRIDRSSPPTTLVGPTGPTSNPAPSFGWGGQVPDAAYLWRVVSGVDGAVVQQGTVPTPALTLPAPLPDGAYTFQVSRAAAFAPVAIPFAVDTAAPAPPAVTAPPAPLAGQPLPFSWTGEDGALFSWQLINSAAAVVRGPGDTRERSLSLDPVIAGAYTFRIAQVDAAGNRSAPATVPLAVGAAPPIRPPSRPPTVPPPARKPGSSRKVVRLPSSHAGRLRPRTGAKLPTRRPMLSWRRGPRATTLYNVQIFRVGPQRAGRVKLTKVVSAFPKRNAYRAPARRLRPGTCYVWRVWPYVGRRFARAPTGISNFCVPPPKELKALRERAKRAARAKARAAAAKAAAAKRR